MTKSVLIICAGGLSSSMIAKKTTDHLKERGYDLLIEARGVPEGTLEIQSDRFDLYLVSPQTKMNFEKLAVEAQKVKKPIVQIPPQAYIPIPMGIEKLANLIIEHLPA